MFTMRPRLPQPRRHVLVLRPSLSRGTLTLSFFFILLYFAWLPMVLLKHLEISVSSLESTVPLSGYDFQTITIKNVGTHPMDVHVRVVDTTFTPPPPAEEIPEKTAEDTQTKTESIFEYGVCQGGSEIANIVRDTLSKGETAYIIVQWNTPEEKKEKITGPVSQRQAVFNRQIKELRNILTKPGRGQMIATTKLRPVVYRRSEHLAALGDISLLNMDPYATEADILLLVEAFHLSPDVKCVESDVPMKIHFVSKATNRELQPSSLKQWGLYNISANVAWDWIKDVNVPTHLRPIVAVIGTGINEHDVNIKPILWRDTKENGGGEHADMHESGNPFGWNFVDNNRNATDESGHGTFCAGIIGSMSTTGRNLQNILLAPRLMACKIIGDTTTQSKSMVSKALKCLNYAATKGANIVNKTWEPLSFSSALHSAIKALQKKNIIVVSSVGDDARDCGITPYVGGGQLDNVVSVASYNEDGTFSRRSNFGRTVHLAAPGSYISSLSNVPDEHMIASGTAAAAAHVSGLLALMYALFPAIHYSEAIRILQETGVYKDWLRGKTIWAKTPNAENACQVAGTGGLWVRLQQQGDYRFSLKAQGTKTISLGLHGLFEGTFSGSLCFDLSTVEDSGFSVRETVPLVIHTQTTDKGFLKWPFVKLQHTIEMSAAIGTMSLPYSVDLSNIGKGPLRLMLEFDLPSSIAVVPSSEEWIEVPAGEPLTISLTWDASYLLFDVAHGSVSVAVDGVDTPFQLLVQCRVLKIRATAYTDGHSQAIVKAGEIRVWNPNDVHVSNGHILYSVSATCDERDALGAFTGYDILTSKLNPGLVHNAWIDTTKMGGYVLDTSHPWAGYTSITVPFDFFFLGETLRAPTFYVSRMGHITIRLDNPEDSSLQSCDKWSRKGIVMPYGGPFVDGDDGKVWFYGDSEKVVVSWVGFRMKNLTPYLRWTFQAVLHKSGTVAFHYKDIHPQYPRPFMGIRNEDNTQGYGVTADSRFPASDTSVLFRPRFDQPPSLSWTSYPIAFANLSDSTSDVKFSFDLNSTSTSQPEHIELAIHDPSIHKTIVSRVPLINLSGIFATTEGDITPEIA